ncbi:ATP-binding protein [Pseudoduganella sp. R-34]|uniref:ATP-binding protein n=1 Tax=Pseudoduganella sp. R-34 TaxID=3404062 RepID=UPI003CFB8438
MSQYLLSFAKENLADKSDAYLALLWCMYKGRQDKGRYSDHIKVHLNSANSDLVKTNYQRIAARFKRILNARPELDWVAPAGLRPLATLQVKNFRGFGTFGPDDKGSLLHFSKIKNIFYAPNGGGKSSLCEALEYGTTGHIKEADRRKTKVKQYIARGAGKVELTLMGTDRKRVQANLTWSSCFIDRNRLQEFSLLGSKDTNSAEGDVIATLFGLEEFQEVISRFVKPESFNLAPHRRPSQNDAVQALDSNRNTLREQRRRHRDNVALINKDVCARLGLETDQQFAVRVRHARLARLAELKLRNAERLKAATVPFTAPMSQIVCTIRIASRLLRRKVKVDEAFMQNVVAVNYRAVYQALQVIEHNSADEYCPACSTPLDRVVENPLRKHDASWRHLEYWTN